MLDNIVLFNPVLIFNTAFTGSALTLFLKFNLGRNFIWLNACSISELECGNGIGYTICVEQKQPVFCNCFLEWHLHTKILLSNMLLCQ